MHCKLLTRILERKYDFIVDSVLNGYLFLQKIEEKSYDLVILDHYMPVMNGTEAILEARKRGFDGIVLGFTAMIEESETFHDFHFAGCDDIMTKPLELCYFNNVIESFGYHNTEIIA